VDRRVVLVAAAAVAGYIVFGRRAPQVASAPAPVRPAETSKALGGEAAPIVLPPLDQSDAVVADLVRKLSSHPQVAAWLTTEGFIRNFTVVVLNISEGKTPARSLPDRDQACAPFRIVDRDRTTYIDAQSYERYAPLAEAVASIDAQGSASCARQSSRASTRRIAIWAAGRIVRSHARTGDRPAAADAGARRSGARAAARHRLRLRGLERENLTARAETVAAHGTGERAHRSGQAARDRARARAYRSAAAREQS
jgi:hypothetical protein